MRVLVCRPERDARETAETLRAMGHAPIAAPLLAIVPVAAVRPAGPFDAIAVTSANAIPAAPIDASLAAAPLFAVGGKTAAAARQHGFSDVRSADGNAATLAVIIARALQPGARVLFLTGDVRKPTLETALAASGLAPVLVETYRTSVATRLPQDAAEALRAGGLDAALHYSRRSAEAFATLSHRAGVAEAARALAHYCLSADVAGPLQAMGARNIRLAAAPDARSLLALLPTDEAAAGRRTRGHDAGRGCA